MAIVTEVRMFIHLQKRLWWIQRKYSQSFNVTVPLIVNDPGNFFAIGALQFYTYDRYAVGDRPTPVAEYRYDVANALDMNLITYEDEPEILTVSIGIANIVLCTDWRCMYCNFVSLVPNHQASKQ